ncbi:MAG: CvpA family protein [Anaerolineales bacterium]|nr:CvpA family protein [Anaerolineales bacterium]MCB8952330.1 CvpA family protein [Ardenticatenales bacterium]
MLSLQTVFWIMIGFFALIGFLRGWTKEVIATSGLVLSLFAVDRFGVLIVSLLTNVPTDSSTIADPYAGLRQQFYVLALVHLLIAFFSYQGPSLAGQLSGGRFVARLRDNLQEKLLGAIVGGFNGYLIVGTLWSFLEYRIISPGSYERLVRNVPYAFDPATIIRPDFDTFASLVEKLPLPLLAPYLPILIVLVFLFVIVVMI